jgi:hypothetical protein
MAVQRPETEERLPESEALTRELDELDVALVELRAHYEQYFLGVDRQPPNTADADVRQRLMKLRTTHVGSAVLKFRIQALHARFLTYDRLWQRTLTEMENGTYRRDLFKARRRRKTGDGPVAEAKSPAKGVPPESPVAPTASLPTASGTQADPARPPSLPSIPSGTQGGAVRQSPVPAVAPITIPIGTQGGVRRPPAPIPTGTRGAGRTPAAGRVRGVRGGQEELPGGRESHHL